MTEQEGKEPAISRDELQVLALQYIDDAASPEDVERLAAALMASPAHRDAFVAACMTGTLLTECCKPHACEIAADCVLLTQPSAGEPIAARRPLLGFLERLMSYGRQTRVAAAVQWLVVALLAGTLLGAVVMGVAIFRGMDPAAGKNETAKVEDGHGRSQAGSTELPAAAVARLGRVKDCRWNGNQPAPEPGQVLPAGRSLNLASGVAEIDFEIGAKLVVQSSTALELVSASSVRLETGKVTVEIKNEAARGFKLLTPDATFIDQGTEFGVEVAPGGSSKVHVFKGLVDVDLKARDGESPPPLQRLTADAGARFESGDSAMTLVADTGENFIRSIDQADRDRHVVAYWRFEDHPVGELVPHTSSNTKVIRGTVDSSFNGNDLFTFSNATRPMFSDSVAADSVLQSGAPNHGCLDNTAAPVGGSPTRDLYTRSRFSHAAPIDIQTMTPAEWTIEASVKAKVLHTGRQTFVGRDGGKSGARLAFRINDQDKFEILFYDVKHHPHKAVAKLAVKENQWYHVAAVSNGQTLRLYVDSRDGHGYRLLATTKLDSNRGSTALGATNPNAEWSVGRGRVNNYTSEWFQGWIDEVRISDVARAAGDFLFAAKKQEKHPEEPVVTARSAPEGTPSRDKALSAQGQLENSKSQLQGGLP